MRPDRIVVGECRGGVALDMLQAMNTGHDGSMTTAHSNSPRDTLARIETMAMMAGMELPIRAIREQIASAIDLVVHQERLRDGTRKVVNVKGFRVSIATSRGCKSCQGAFSAAAISRAGFSSGKACRTSTSS